MEINLLELVRIVQKEITAKRWGECPVCGMDEWCGTDGCPKDPQ